jgi:hypothetical protein
MTLDPMVIATKGVWTWDVDPMAKATQGYIQQFVQLVWRRVIHLTSAIASILNLESAIELSQRE